MKGNEKYMDKCNYFDYFHLLLVLIKLDSLHIVLS